MNNWQIFSTQVYLKTALFIRHILNKANILKVILFVHFRRLLRAFKHAIPVSSIELIINKYLVV